METISVKQLFSETLTEIRQLGERMSPPLSIDEAVTIATQNEATTAEEFEDTVLTGIEGTTRDGATNLIEPDRYLRWALNNMLTHYESANWKRNNEVYDRFTEEEATAHGEDLLR